MTERQPAVRASDAERERVARMLSDHGAAGRLTPEELDRLLDDLPATPAPRAEDPGRALARAQLAHRAGLSVIACLVAVGIWAAAGASGSFWPVWVILLAAVGLARASWRTLGPGAGLTDEELGERRRRASRRRLRG